MLIWLLYPLESRLIGGGERDHWSTYKAYQTTLQLPLADQLVRTSQRKQKIRAKILPPGYLARIFRLPLCFIGGNIDNQVSVWGVKRI